MPCAPAARCHSAFPGYGFSMRRRRRVDPAELQRLFEAEHRARVRLESVQKVSDAALHHLELEELLHELLVRIREILGTDTAAILMLDEPAQELVARAAVGL